MAFDKRDVVIGRGGVNNFATPDGLIIHTYHSDVDNQAVIDAPGYFADFLGATSAEVIVGDLLIARDSTTAFLFYKLDTVAPVSVSPVSVGSNPFDQSLNTTDAVTFVTVDTGQGANELFPMDQSLLSTSNLVVDTIDTGLGPTNVYGMDQTVQTDSQVDFDQVTTTGLGVRFPTVGGTEVNLDYYGIEVPAAMTWTGAFTANQNTTIYMEKIGRQVTLTIDGLTAAQNTTTALSSTTGVVIPALRPSSPLALNCGRTLDNGVPYGATLTVFSDGTLALERTEANGFTGVGSITLERLSVTYSTTQL